MQFMQFAMPEVCILLKLHGQNSDLKMYSNLLLWLLLISSYNDDDNNDYQYYHYHHHYHHHHQNQIGKAKGPLFIYDYKITSEEKSMKKKILWTKSK